MEKITCQVLPFASGSGAENMAADEVLLQNARPGLVLLRFYAWSTPTISLGYFQPAAARDPWPELPFVRRATGGGMLLHHHEITYAVAVTVREAKVEWLRRMHLVIGDALRHLAVQNQLVGDDVRKSSNPLCFHQFAREDVVCGGAKVVGSAQRKQGSRLIQHGSVLLARSEHTVDLQGVLERTGLSLVPAKVCVEIERAIQRRFDWNWERRTWLPQELSEMKRLAEVRYSQEWWNKKR